MQKSRILKAAVLVLFALSPLAHAEDPSEMAQLQLRHPTNHSKLRTLGQDDITEIEPLLVEVLRQGKLTYTQPSIEEMRRRRIADLERLDPGVRRLLRPHIYHVSLTQRLWDLKQELIQTFRK